MSRVEDDDESRYLYEGFGPPPPLLDRERLDLQRFMQRVVRDALAHEADYGALRHPLILLCENYARTCLSRAELTRRLAHDARAPEPRGAAARLLERIWAAEQAARGQPADGRFANGRDGSSGRP